MSEPHIIVALRSIAADAAALPPALPAAEDPSARALFLAAADHLGQWWDANPGANFEG